MLAVALGRLGFRLEWRDDTIAAHGRDAVATAELDLGNNGTGARLVLAQLAALPGEWRLDGAPRLRERPVGGLVTALRALGADIAPAGPRQEGTGDALPLRVRGRPLRGGTVVLDASASSQFVSALLLLAPRLPDGVAVELAVRHRVAAVVLVSAYTSAVDMGRRIAPLLPASLVMAHRLDTLSRAKDIAQPTLVVHGDSDEMGAA